MRGDAGSDAIAPRVRRAAFPRVEGEAGANRGPREAPGRLTVFRNGRPAAEALR